MSGRGVMDRVLSEIFSFEASTITAPGLRPSSVAISMGGNLPAMLLSLAISSSLQGRLELAIRSTPPFQIFPQLGILRKVPGKGNSGGICSSFRLPNLVRHPRTEIAVFWLGLASLHKRDAGSAMRNAVAIENGDVHQRVVKNMSDDRGERLSPVNVRKAVVAGKAGRREPDNAADSRKNLSHGSISLDESFGCFRPTAAREMILNDCPAR
jgi:hypothetical protein